jgi:TatA/E family protein of Tat protein translocase
MEIVIVLVLALLVFGPKRLPQAGRSLGQAMREFRKVTSNARSELGLDEVIDGINDVKSSVSLGLKDSGVTDAIADIKANTTIDLNATGKSTAVAGAATVAAGVPAADKPAQAPAPANDVVPLPGPDTAATAAPASAADGLETAAPEEASSVAAVTTPVALEVESSDAQAASVAAAVRAGA